MRQLLAGKVSAFTGNSGVGKSTLLNALFPEFALKTGEVSQKLGRGRHTTREVELYKLEGGGYVADTPGFSTFDIERYRLTDKEKLPYGFREFLPLSGPVPVHLLLPHLREGLRHPPGGGEGGNPPPAPRELLRNVSRDKGCQAMATKKTRMYDYRRLSH